MVGAKAAGGRSSEIAAQIGCAKRTIDRTIQRLEETEKTFSRPRTDAPAKLDDRDEREILPIARRIPEITYFKL